MSFPCYGCKTIYGDRNKNGFCTECKPECPGPDCRKCNNSVCNLCGAGCWNNSSNLKCEHDSLERHEEPDYSFLNSDSKI